MITIRPKAPQLHHFRRLFLLLACLILASAAVVYALALFSVAATVETASHAGDADDPALWIHPTDPSLSIVIGTYKTAGMAVYNLDGTERQFLDLDGGMNNVDIRYNFPLGGEKIDLVVATNRDDTHNTLVMYKVNSSTRMLENITAYPQVPSAVAVVYGSCMYVSPFTGKYYNFLTSKTGIVEQWELFDNGSGKVGSTMVRTFDVGSQSEGCVADDVFADFYISHESTGIWQYGAEPTDGNSRTAVDLVTAGHLTSDVEGLTIYYTNDNKGYLMASSQGSSEYVIYDRLGNHDYLSTFEIGAGNGIDVVTATDGIDVANVSLGPLFPQGAFLSQDGDNDPKQTNFKLVPWQDIAHGTNPDLTIDTSWNPRLVGLAPQADFSAGNRVGAPPLTVNFNDQSSGVRTAWYWDFGDNSTSTAQNPSHTYNSIGKYTVSLTVYNSFGSSTQMKTDYVNSGGTPDTPAAAFLPITLSP